VGRIRKQSDASGEKAADKLRAGDKNVQSDGCPEPISPLLFLAQKDVLVRH
jgi:hypothetical protein